MNKVRYIVKSGELFYDIQNDKLTDEILGSSLLHYSDDVYFIANDLNIKNERKYTAHKVKIIYEID